MSSTMNGGGKLVAPERNNFFYGKLMDVPQFEKEQRYFNQKRLLLNRLALGSGIVCGLNVVRGAGGTLSIQPGVVIDKGGREITIPATIPVNPHQLTDDLGDPVGAPIEEGTITICLAYAETCTDPVPVLVPDCDTPGNCAPSTFQEGFRILVRQTEDNIPQPPACRLNLGEVPPEGSFHEHVHVLLCERISAPCLEAPQDMCVELARVTLPLNEESIDSCTGRSIAYSNALLYELILCLAERVGQLARGRILRYVAGDGQTGAPGAQLVAPLVVEILDGEDHAVQGVLVQFEVMAGTGSINPTTVETDQEGLAQTQWTVGSEEGEQRVAASAVGTASTVTFRATAAPPGFFGGFFR